MNIYMVLQFCYKVFHNNYFRLNGRGQHGSADIPCHVCLSKLCPGQEIFAVINCLTVQDIFYSNIHPLLRSQSSVCGCSTSCSPAGCPPRSLLSTIAWLSVWLAQVTDICKLIDHNQSYPGLGPAANFCFLKVVTSLDLEQRAFWCKPYILLNAIIVSLFFYTFFFSFLFRSVLVRFADRGLVSQGKPRIQLFNQLYWIIFCCYFTIGLFYSPILSFFRGSFKESFHGQVCLCVPLVKDSVQLTFSSLIPPIVFMFFIQYYWYKVKQYLTILCPKRQMACMGKYRRNMLTMEEISRYISYYSVYNVIVVLLRNPNLPPQLIFWTQTAPLQTSNFILLGIFLPLKILLTTPWEEKNHQAATKDFYVRKPEMLSPRRDPTLHLNSVLPLYLCLRGEKGKGTGRRSARYSQSLTTGLGSHFEDEAKSEQKSMNLLVQRKHFTSYI